MIKASRHDVSASLSQLVVGGVRPTKGPDREAEKPRATGPAINSGKVDPVASELAGPLTGVTTLTNCDGQSADDNRRVFGFAFVPPDTNGAVGTKQYVQMVNVTIAVYDKSDGSLELGPAPIHSLWNGLGGLCEFGGETEFYSDGGDPVVLYDRMANRWLVSQLQYDETFTHSAQCLAISTTSDATGSYNRYQFDFGTNFPDYPKFGIWPDGYYNSINVYPGNSFAGAAACAFDRNAMLAGAAASAICFQQPPSVASLLPSDLDGSTLPPAGAPNYFVALADSNHLNLFRFHADFAKPANSTFTGPLVQVADYNEICARAITVACIPEPAPGEKVDGLADRVMFRLAYRNFGDHESLVVNHTVAGGALGGVRWYEIRNFAARGSRPCRRPSRHIGALACELLSAPRMFASPSPPRPRPTPPRRCRIESPIVSVPQGVGGPGDAGPAPPRSSASRLPSERAHFPLAPLQPRSPHIVPTRRQGARDPEGGEARCVPSPHLLEVGLQALEGELR